MVRAKVRAHGQMAKRLPALDPVSRLVEYEDIGKEAWCRLERAADDPSHPMRVAALATIDLQNRPALRSMVMRGVDRASGRVWLHTDARSNKVQHVARCPRVSLMVYDPGDGVQLRVQAAATLHLMDALADNHWDQLELAVRYAYATADPPGMPLAARDPRAAARFRLGPDAQDAGRQHFAVIELLVQGIEWFQTNAMGQRRAIILHNGELKSRPLTP